MTKSVDAAEAVVAAEEAERKQRPPGPETVVPTDPRYRDLILRGYNKRFVGQPESIYIVGNTSHVVRAVNEAVKAGKRIAVRAGGHNLDGLVDDPEVQVVIDFTEMRSVTFDTAKNAFAIQPGATGGQIYRTLDYGWGVTVPGGICPAVGIGGLVLGGGVGAVSRKYGLTADLLHAVEVVVVGANGTAKAVVATRERDDPNRELWWAHAGGGGGNFGVATRFWFRLPGGKKTTNPSLLLPKVPGGHMVGRAIWNWSDMTKESFRQLAKNFGIWHEQNSAPGSPGNEIYASLIAPRIESGRILVSGQVDPTVPGTEQLLADFLAAVAKDVVPAPQILNTGNQPWLTTTINIPDTAVVLGVVGPPRSKTKGGYLKKRYSDDQIDKAFYHLTRPDYTPPASSFTISQLSDNMGLSAWGASHPASSFTIASYGGQINSLDSSATAAVHRDSIMLASVFSVWDVPAEDAIHLAWNRALYRDLYSDTGGVPVPNDRNSGCYINWPDVDLLDPVLNTSNVPWYTLYYKENYPRLQKVKAKWDPCNVFRHTLSIQPPS